MFGTSCIKYLTMLLTIFADIDVIKCLEEKEFLSKNSLICEAPCAVSSTISFSLFPFRKFVSRIQTGVDKVMYKTKKDVRKKNY